MCEIFFVSDSVEGVCVSVRDSVVRLYVRDSVVRLCLSDSVESVSE